MPILGGGQYIDGSDEFKVKVCCGATSVVLLIVTFFMSFTVVPVGSVGIVSVLGKVNKDPLLGGWYMLTPYVSNVAYLSTRLTVLHFAADVPTSEGVTVHLEASCINSLDPTMAVDLFKSVGVDFENKVIQPEFQSIVRTVTSAHSSQSLYNASSRNEMADSLRSKLKLLLGPRGIIVHASLINKLQLPSTLEKAIETKMAIQQQYEQMGYVIQKQKKVKQQLEIQASGIATYQRIIAAGIDERVLRWKGIETTKNIALDPRCNPKLVFIGGGGNDERAPLMLPLMLQQFGDTDAPANPGTSAMTSRIVVDAAGPAHVPPPVHRPAEMPRSGVRRRTTLRGG